MTTKTKPRYGEGQKVNTSLTGDKILQINGEPEWNGITWMYSFVSEDISCGEDYICRVTIKKEEAKQTPPAATELFTPGEWRVELRQKIFVDEMHIANALQQTRIDIFEASANAALIAAAPDLYYALKEILLKIQRLQYTLPAIEKAEAALQKANPNYKP